MAIEIKIGKEESGEFAITVPKEYSLVSRHHAKVVVDDGIVTFIDNDSTNGSFVNGSPVVSTRIKKTDVIRLGGVAVGNYQLDMEALFGIIDKVALKTRTDFRKEFVKLKETFENYKKEVNDVKINATKKSQMPRLVATLVPAAVGLILMPFVGGEARIVVISIGSVISALVGIFTMGKNNDTTDEITEIQIKYQKDYKCPKCGKEIPLTMHWRKLEESGECPHKCGAKFK